MRDVEAPFANFFASGVPRLGKKFGPVLWQFPPSFKFDEKLFAEFLAMLPHDTNEAVLLAKRHDARSKNPVWVETDKKRKVRHAVEIRDKSFRDERFVELLRQYNVALVCADTVEWPRLMDVTSDFIYCRLHGSEKLYASGYATDALHAWERRVRDWAKGSEPKDAERVGGPAKTRKAGRDVFMYFDNDIKVKAPENAAELAKSLRLK